MTAILEKVLRLGEGRILKKLSGIAAQVNALEDSFTALSDAELREETDRFRARLDEGEKLDDLLPEAFAAVREASRRTLGQRHFDVQLMGGAALHLGNIAEMKTGEGKTLVATLPAYLNALSGKGVHVVTVNDYLAGYQADLMGRVYRFLGLTTGTILSQQTPAQRREQYAADITYGTNNEFGFDYLRDNMAWSVDDLVQRGHHFAIVDEVDSILIDEARTPLIISGPASGDTNRWYAEFAKVVRRLQPERDYEVDEKKRTVGVLEPGIARVEDYLGIDNLYESLNTPLIGFLNNAIKAKELFKRDKDYVVMNGEVLIVDEHTGRILPGRRYNEGMHQAIEAKEGVAIKAENQTLATITLQNYFRLYGKLAGMTGTAETEAAEFQGTYKLGVVPIPTNRPMLRIDQKDLVYKSEEGKFDAVVTDIVERHAKGQPVLVGTTSVEKSELLSSKLKKQGVPHEVLNAKQHAREASIVAQAGRKGAVTVATNMAGRGTDIMLGGNAEFMAVAEMAARGLDPAENADEYEAVWPEVLEKAKVAVSAEHDEVTELGGLYVLGTERHESRRIDNQLRGRSGRQGDPGESRFYLSMQDDLMRLFNSGLAESMMTRAGFPEDMPLESKIVTRGIQSAQSQVEARNFEIRKNVLKYDDVMSRQREVIYDQRRRVLEGEDLQEQITHFRTDVLTDYIALATAEGRPEDWDLEALWTVLRGVYPISITPEEVVEEAGGPTRLSAELLTREVLSDAEHVYAEREEKLGGANMRQLERRVVLSVLDRKWREHLYEMDYLKEGIGLRAMAQRDPLIEYQREGFQLFTAMTDAIKEESVQYLYNLEVQVTQPTDGPVVSADSAASAAASAGASATADRPVVDGPAADGEPAPGGLVAKGLDGPAERTPLQYTAPSADGDGATVTRADGGSGGARPAETASGGANRADRRKQAKQRRR
ncbi:preprotein translocase subunit SecA [Cellulomonas sp. zg-ZUI222]|uniref:Protein translocase subunit SecA n=1 Tax=Cellulomonas wangleii TaxID=2816956 RepID=A0ABX8D121_9CELL|nr:MULTISPECIES: preprotein translocase subunit SecA [Cellulomonas]MBO0899896.1 preprotein translocase subunit SecA [Cellulomonas sp. zg-ZUI22]MBO0921190.1 preprotein translocase subunit SecA [Cellulomonas wangleii]MBO0925328.1 preprotein translocase subunit SecA [Cellulomonas wangleii]QVI61177.1 preprotein translocase subunit SecA [Cellulomonas wangleii]